MVFPIFRALFIAPALPIGIVVVVQLIGMIVIFMLLVVVVVASTHGMILGMFLQMEVGF